MKVFAEKNIHFLDTSYLSTLSFLKLIFTIYKSKELTNFSHIANLITCRSKLVELWPSG